MPIEWLMDYWGKAAKATLPFLQNRHIAVQQLFDRNTIYRRHGDKGLPDKYGWITIDREDQITAWAKLHAYSFHPHLKGDKDTWFVIDIDARTDALFDLTRLATYEMAKLLDKKGIKYLLKFSGHRGFHFMWSLGKARPDWRHFRKEIRLLTQELEEQLQAKYADKFYRVIPKKSPILTTSSTNRFRKKAILVDEQIIHKNSMIRSPYSVHPGTGLVSLPLTKTQVLKFNVKSALPGAVKVKKIKLPKNKSAAITVD